MNPPARDDGHGRWSQYEEGMAVYNSFYGAALVVSVAYWALYIPGLILNVFWIIKAHSAKKRVGYAPAGSGCLWMLLLLGLVPLAIYLWVAGIVTLPAWLGAESIDQSHAETTPP